jgi:DNA replication protein DnaC
MPRPRITAKQPIENKRYYDSEYTNDFPISNYYCDIYGLIPDVITTSNNYDLAVMEELYNYGFELVWDRNKIIESEVYSTGKVLKKDDVLLKMTFKGTKFSDFDDDDYFESDSKDKIPDSCNVNIYHTEQTHIPFLIEVFKKYLKIKEKGGKISLVISRQSGLSTVDHTITPFDIDIAKNYGASFVPVHNKIVEKLNEDKGKGLVLLHGDPGTGKTTYIRYLANKVDKQIIFIPPYLTENISSPDFIPFLLKNTNSILIIEDAEKVILDRDGSESNRQGVSNLLNLTDGVLSDCLNIQVIATFNTSRDRIDKALLRKGRLIGEFKFDKLSVEDSNIMLEHIGKEYRTNVPMALTEIYNIDEVEYVSSKKDRGPIGFTNR